MPPTRPADKKPEGKYVNLEMEGTLSMRAVVDLNEFNRFCEEAIGHSNQANAEQKKQDKKTQSNLAIEQFNEYVLEAVDETLASLGEPVKNTIYQHLETDFDISRDEIPQKICDFSDLLRKFFGVGASRLEAKLVKNLSTKIKNKAGLSECEANSPKWLTVDFSFTNYVCTARRNFTNALTEKQTSQ